MQHVDTVAARGGDHRALLCEQTASTLALVEGEMDDSRKVAPAVRTQCGRPATRREYGQLELREALRERRRQATQVCVGATRAGRIQEQRIEADVHGPCHDRIVGCPSRGILRLARAAGLLA